ncbi:MAG: DNA primase [Fimbriimonadaceae bacterium]
MSDDVDLVRSRVDLVALVGQRVRLRRTGKSWKGLCPFHDDRNPSFQVDPDIGRYRCWSCGAKGDAFDWVMQTESVEFGEALRQLAKDVGIELKGRAGPPKEHEAMEAAMSLAQDFFRQGLEQSQSTKEYLAGRGIADDVAAQWGLGFSPPRGDALAHELQREGHKLALCEQLFLVGRDQSGAYYDRFRGRLMFPIRDERGRLVAFGGRALGDAQPKYINSGDTPIFRKGRILYGMDIARQAMASGEPAYLCEGYLDVIAMHRAGLTSAVAPLGTALSTDHAKLLRRWTEKVVIVFDGDEAGVKASERSVQVLSAENLYIGVALLPSGSDPDSVLAQHGAEAVRSAVGSPHSVLAFSVAMVERRRKPADPAFWREIVEAIAASNDHMEAAAQVDRLARHYPGTRDLAAARAALERTISDARPKPKKVKRAAGSPTAAPPAMPGLESVLFRALVVPELRMDAWAALVADVADSEVARSLVTALKATFGNAGPTGATSNWIAQIADEGARGALEDLIFAQSVATVVDAETLSEAVSRLEGRAASRRRVELRDKALVDDEVLELLSQELKSSKGRGI